MSDDTLTLTLYGEIGYSWWGEGTTANDVAAELEKHPSVETINVRINSPGGDVFDAVAILAQLQRHPARIVVDVDGVAASAASVIAMAGDEIHISEGGFIMIHEASGGTYGSAQDHERTAGLLSSINNSMADVYARRSRTPKDELLDAMSAETWYSAHEAVEVGLADRVVLGKEVVACAGLSRFRRVPAGLAARATAGARRPPPPPVSDRVLQLHALATHTPKGARMELSVLISTLGIAADSDESAVLQAIAVLRSERGELSTKVDKLSADLAERDAQVEDLSGKLASLEADKVAAQLDGKIAALKADARITDSQETIIRELFAAGHTESAMNLAASFKNTPKIAPTGPRQSLLADDAGSNRKPSTTTAPGDIDWHALAKEVPAHVRELAGTTLATDPRGFIELNKHKPWAKALGIDWAAVPGQE